MTLEVGTHISSTKLIEKYKDNIHLLVIGSCFLRAKAIHKKANKK
jgi:hypothetical protein